MTAIDGVKHDTTELEELLGGIQRRLRVIVDEDRLAELVPIWKRPGWTTPAEFFLVRETLTSISAQVDDLERQVNVVVRGADMVGRG